jgi:hypothetical protein
MKTWIWGIIFFCLALLAGCGGGFTGGRVHVAPAPLTSLGEGDDLRGEELSAKRLEELYAKSGIPGSDPALEEELKKWDHRINFDMPIQMNKQVRAYLVYFSTERKDVIRRQLARSSRYLPMIKEVFQEYGLPEDLAYLAMVESGFNPNACSPAGACGMWQFIKATGQRYSLIIDGYVDERRSPAKSTRAAAQYLTDLYKQFGSWYLAAASYNCGERRVQQELKKSHHKNFWELSANQCLPGETKNYVPQLIAATIIAKHPEKFGFTNVAYQPPLTRGEWETAGSASGMALASAASSPKSSAKISRLSPSPSRSLPVAQASPVGQKSAGNLKSARKPATQVARARSGRSRTQGAAQGDCAPYTASLLGAPGHGSHKHAAGKPKPNGHATAGSKKSKSSLALQAAKGKKKSPAPVARKSDSRARSKAQARKKNGSVSKDSKLAKSKTRSKSLVLSEAR